MEIVSFILSEEKVTSRVKVKCILMVATCNIDKASQIFHIITECKQKDPEVIDNVLLKLDKIQAYNILIHNINTNTNKRKNIEPSPFKLNSQPNNPQNNNSKRMKVAHLASKHESIPKTDAPLSTNLQNHSLKKQLTPKSKLFTCLFFLNYPLQCRVCGFRFVGDADGKTLLCQHLNEHKRRDVLEQNIKSLGQEYFSTFDQFVSKVNRIQFEEIQKEEEFIEAENAYCEICKEKIDILWNDERSSWMLVGVVPIEDQGGRRYCHRKCIT